ncbi:MAG: hypothetical protein HY299_19650 [Verrucomicrobia bacterium]|nr:hypothetical protein [Verrucomicrobiota bacterium]
MRTILLRGLFLLVMAAQGAAASSAPLPHYINKGPITALDPTPQINAVSFENRNQFSVSTFRPYETFNTLNFTNTASGTLANDQSGFWFDYSFLGGRGSMSNWVNRGLVSGFGWVWVDSMNILNAGQGIGVGSRGVVHLNGDNVNLSRSGLYTGNRFGTTSGSILITNGGGGDLANASSFSDGGIIDNYWGISSNQLTHASLAADFTLPNPVTPSHLVTGTSIGFGGGLFNRFTFSTILPNGAFRAFTNLGTNVFTPLSNYTAFTLTNFIGGAAIKTNIIQVVFVPTNGLSQGVNIDVGWTPNRDAAGNMPGWGFGNTAMVEFSLADFDPVAQLSFTNYLFLQDFSAFQNTNRTLVPNSSSALTPQASTRRPNVFTLRRFDFSQLNGRFVSTNNATYDPTLISNPDYLSNVVTLTYAGYSGQLILGENTLGNKTSIRVGDVGWSGLPINDISNFPGRVEINAKKLNLDNVRIHAQSGLIIKADDLVGNKLPIVDAPLLSYDVASKQSTLTVSNLVRPNVNRLIGDVSAYSAIWQNASTNGGTTNVYQFHVLFIDHTLSITQQVVLQDLKLRATNVVIGDYLTVGRNFLIDARNLTVAATGGITNGSGFDLGGTNLVNIWNFTNLGTFAVNRELRFGSDSTDITPPVSNIVNYGNLLGASVDLRAQRIINTNVIAASSASVSLDATDVMMLPGSSLTSLGPVILTGTHLTASNSVIAAGVGTAGGNLVLDFSDSVMDGGIGTSNIWVTSDGFTIANVHPTGDLLYTTIISTATNENEVIHYVGSTDMGVVPEGYVNNLALGRLVLDGSTNTVFRFSPPPGVENVALYVDYLELRNFATNYQDSIVVDEGCRLYFANCSVSPLKVAHSSEERVRWVSTYAGPASTTNIVYTVNAVNYPVDLNLGLATLADIDSDNDGVQNSADTTPVWIPQQAQLAVILTNYLDHPQIVAVVGRALQSYDNGLTINYATNSILHRAGLAGPFTVISSIVTPVVNVPSQSVPFIFYDLGATNILGTYSIRIDVSEPR